MNIIVIQPALPAYRLPFFSRLSEQFGPRFVVYASRQKEMGVLENSSNRPIWSRELGEVQGLPFGLEWQAGAMHVPLKKGDVLVVCGAPRTLSTIGLLLKAKLIGATALWWGHYWSSTSLRWRVWLRLKLMRLADVVVFYTDQEVAEYKSHQYAPANFPIYALNNGIETQEIKTLRTSYEASQRKRDLLFIGRVNRKAGLSTLIHAMALPECADILLDVIGEGPEVETLQLLAKRSGIAKRIAWHGGITDEIRISEILNRCKVFVYPGSVGLSLIHAMAYGLPAIVHDDRWTNMPEIAAHLPGKTGLLFRKEDAHSLAHAMSSLVFDAPTLNRMSALAIDVVGKTYNAADMANRFVSLINDISRADPGST